MNLNHPNSDSPLITWPCYEPAGHRVVLTESELVQHVLLVGSTGSGKSTLIISALEQLIAHPTASSQGKIGLLVLDAKGDDLVARVEHAALRSGRANDVLLFGPQGGCGFDLFGCLRSFEEVDRLTRWTMLGTEPFGSENLYWWQSTTAMLRATFTLLAASEQPITYPNTVDSCAGGFCRRRRLQPYWNWHSIFAADDGNRCWPPPSIRLISGKPWTGAPGATSNRA